MIKAKLILNCLLAFLLIGMNQAYGHSLTSTQHQLVLQESNDVVDQIKAYAQKNGFEDEKVIRSPAQTSVYIQGVMDIIKTNSESSQTKLQNLKSSESFCNDNSLETYKRASNIISNKELFGITNLSMISAKVTSLGVLSAFAFAGTAESGIALCDPKEGNPDLYGLMFLVAGEAVKVLCEEGIKGAGGPMPSDCQ